MVTVTKCEKKPKGWMKDGVEVPIYAIEFSDGQKGDSLKNEIPVGTSIDKVTITPNANPSYSSRVALKKEGGANGWKGAAPKGNESFAMSYAKDLVVADKVKIEQLIPTADKIYDWLENKKK